MVSVIIINFNTFEYTCKCIRSIYQETNSVLYEIILVDNGSSECDPELFKLKYPDIILIKNSKNLGFSKANNLGIKSASGNIILLLNSDTELINNAIKLSSDILTSDNAIGIVSAQLQFPDGRIQNSCQSFPSIGKELIELARLHKFFSKDYAARILRGSFFNHRESVYTEWVWGTFFMFRRSDLNKLKLKKLADDFFIYGEDLEWCFQFFEIGLKTFFAADSKVIHLMGGSNYGNNEMKLKQIIKHELLFIRKYHSELFLLFFRIIRSLNFLSLSFRRPEYLKFIKFYFQKI